MKKKNILIFVAAFFVFSILMGILFGDKSPEQQEPVAEETKAPEETKEPEGTPVPEEEPEPNTSAMVDSIILKAKEDAAAGVTEEKAQEAFTAIYDAYPDFFTDNETMESLMYYGAYLEYGFEGVNDGFYNLGMDTVQAIKYVYRGAEKVEDAATQENLDQIGDLFTSLAE